jgi:hypothetical protein
MDDCFSDDFTTLDEEVAAGLETRLDHPEVVLLHHKSHRSLMH